MASGRECDEAERAYDRAEQRYLSAIRADAPVAEFREIADETRRTAERWMAVLYDRLFEQQRVQDPYARDTEIAAEIAEAFEAFWAEIALAYKDAPKVAPGEG